MSADSRAGEHQENDSAELSEQASPRRTIRYIRDPVETANNEPPSGRQRRRQGPARRPILSRGLALKIIEDEGLPENLVNTSFRVFPRLKRHLQQQPVNATSAYLEARMRMTALYTRQTSLTQWRDAYRNIFSNKFHGRETEATMPKLTEDGQVLLRKIQSDCLGDFRDVWKGLDRTIKATHWQPLALWLLQTSPQLMLQFLLVTSEGLERPNFHMIESCFNYLDYFHFDEIGNWKNGSHTYQSVLQTCMDPETWPILLLSQRGVQLYLNRGNCETATRAFDTMCHRQTHMSPETALMFMRDFTEYGDVDRALMALSIVLQLKQPGFTRDSVGVMRHCCKLLTLDSVEDNARGRNFRILPKLLEMGVRPDRDMMNVVLSNAFKIRDSQLGHDMLEFMKGQGHEMDSYTYLALLVDAVEREDREHVEGLVSEISRNEKLRTNEFLLNKIFHAHYVFTAKRMDPRADPGEVFYSVLDMYNQLHDITPLRELSILPPHYTPPPGSANTPPTLIALYIMIATYFRCQRRVSVVERVYREFRRLVLSGHEMIAPLAETEHTYNEFLLALRDNPEGLRLCVRIVEDMLEQHRLHSQGRARAHAKPTFRTWTILLSAFIYNRRPLAAQKVREMMAKHNIEYNDVTWNVIISGYATVNNVPETAQAIKQMEAAGYPIDPYTVRGLRFLRNPEELWVAIEELDKVAEKKKEAEKEKADAESRASSAKAAAGGKGEKGGVLLDRRLRHLKGRMDRN
jgi:pentatricopeptide repeat protein